jgi:hypothetical protein
MLLKHFLYKFLILKQVNGFPIIPYKDLDMVPGYIRKIYISMEDFNYQVPHCQLIQFLSLISVCFLKITKIFMEK